MTDPAPYLTLTSEGVQALPTETQAELLKWLAASVPNPDITYRVTFGASAEDVPTLTVVELDPTDPHYLAHVRIVPPGPRPALPDHLRAHFEAADSFL